MRPGFLGVLLIDYSARFSGLDVSGAWLAAAIILLSIIAAGRRSTRSRRG